MQNVVDTVNEAAAKQEWARPVVRRIEAGSAESEFSGSGDGTGQEQS